MRVGIVGAGISGLAAAWRLRQAGADVVVYEAAPRVGGRMGSVTTGGLVVDTGAHMLLDSYDRTKALSWEVGLGRAWYPLEGGTGGGIVRGDTIVSFSPEGALDALRFEGFSLLERLRLFAALLEGWTWRDDLDFFDLSASPDALDLEDCDTFARRRMGDTLADLVVDAFIRTFHFHGARRMSRVYFEALAALLARRGQLVLVALEGYMQSLPDALAARLDVRRSVAVSRVEPGGVVVADGRSETFDAVVLATPATVARRLLAAPSPAQRVVLDSASYASSAVVDLLVPGDVAHTFQGVWVPYRESAIVSGISNETAKGSARDGDRVLVACLHDEAADVLLRSDDDAIVRAVTDEIVRLFPRYEGHLRPLRVQRWPDAMPIYAPGRVTTVKRFWEQGQGEDGVWLCGDWLNHPWVEGAVRCGEKVAQGISSARLPPGPTPGRSSGGTR